jgi:hypothetical protein
MASNGASTAFRIVSPAADLPFLPFKLYNSSVKPTSEPTWALTGGVVCPGRMAMTALRMLTVALALGPHGSLRGEQATGLGVEAAVRDSTTGSIVGLVMDSSGAAIRNAEVTITGQSSEFSRSTKSNEHGRFTFAKVPAKEIYLVTVRRVGYEPAHENPISVVVRLVADGLV